VVVEHLVDVVLENVVGDDVVHGVEVGDVLVEMVHGVVEDADVDKLDENSELIVEVEQGDDVDDA
jgi:hypothetical protein